MYSKSTDQQCDVSYEAERETVLTLRDVALAYVGSLLFAEDDVEPLGAEQTYLFNHFAKMRHVKDFKTALSQCLQQPGPRDALLANLAGQLQLSQIEIVALVLALLVEEEPMIGRVLSHIQAPVGGSRPSLGLLESVLSARQVDGSGWLGGALISGRAVSSGVLQMINEQAPLPEQAVKVPLGLALALRGKPFVWPGTRNYVTEEAINLPVSTHETAVRQSDALGRSPNSVLVIRSASHREAQTVAAEVAMQMGLVPLLISANANDLNGLGVTCRVSGCLPVFDYGLNADEISLVPELAAYTGPRLVLTGPDTQIKIARGTILQWTLMPPTRHEREQLWLSYLPESNLAERLASEHIHSAGRISDLAQLATREAELQQRKSPQIEDIRHAAWEAEAGLLGSLAQPLRAEITDEALVLSKSVDLELQQLLARCRSREDLDEGLGITIKARYQQGVRCLMVGPSGTGKTLVASWLATRLGLPLYRVDLASVVSKYIGETEKNLATLLARAEHSEIVLLFDEADSLFGKRTDIKDSNDRFANSQTNYLLQRIEFYRGIVLLTSNSRERFDDAFTRRLDKIIEFPMPTPQERRALWWTHLGNGHLLSTKQINQLAVGSDLAGGHIRNAVLTAAVEARDAGRPIAFNDVVVGLAGEYRKQGRQFPAELRRYERAVQEKET